LSIGGHPFHQESANASEGLMRSATTYNPVSKYDLRVFENRVLKRIFRPKKE
jgi:hypothetical protein